VGDFAIRYRPQKNLKKRVGEKGGRDRTSVLVGRTGGEPFKEGPEPNGRVDKKKVNKFECGMPVCGRGFDLDPGRAGR